jgi:hypothetical protein
MVRRVFGVGERCNGSGLSVGSRLNPWFDMGVNGDGVGGVGELRFVGVVGSVSCSSSRIETAEASLGSPSSFWAPCTSFSPSLCVSSSPAPSSTRPLKAAFGREAWLSSCDSSSSSSESWTNPFCRHLDIWAHVVGRSDAGGVTFCVLVECMSRRPVLTLACWREERRTARFARGSARHTPKRPQRQFTTKKSKMAGRILPVALAAIVGVSIGVATFDGEFKKQKMARLEEEYKRYVESDSLSPPFTDTLIENLLLLLLRALPVMRLQPRVP